jgi:formylglycine-generating enzyme required for sulfatase activity
LEKFQESIMGENGSCCTPGGKRCNCPEKPVGFQRVSSGRTGGMVLLSGGTFLMGTDDPVGFYVDGEVPVREVRVDAFWIDETSVTNDAFGKFIEETGYRTDAEAFNWSYVFHLFLSDEMKRELYCKGRCLPGLEWWFAVEGADWAHPEGPGSSVKGRMDHPAVHVSWRDAQAYCRWAGKRLPTEAEFEYAARGGLVQKRYVWGDELTPGGRHMCNIWQGDFPRRNTAEDGFAGTSPVRTYEPNGCGLYDMAGNIWEWMFDRWSPDFHVSGPRDNPLGPPSGDRRVTRGGSYLCHDSYCNRYRVAARTSNTPDSSAGNTGFRCVRDAG